MLTIRNLRKTYEDATVVDDVSLDLPHGKVISMIGPNGAGKSTVLGMISRLVAKVRAPLSFRARTSRNGKAGSSRSTLPFSRRPTTCR